MKVLRTAKSVIEEEFGSIEGRFEAEMARMAEEMARFRTRLMLDESEYQHQQQSRKSTHSTSTYSSSSTTRTTSSTSTATALNEREQEQQKAVDEEEEVEQQKSSCLSGLSSPLIKNSAENGPRILSIRFDVRSYEPDQIVVKTVDNLLTVHAKLEQNGPHSSLRREYNREFLLPEGTKLELIRSTLSADGVLTIEAPLP